jgi:hypothetical protein
LYACTHLVQQELHWTEFCAATTTTISELAGRRQYQPNKTDWKLSQLNRTFATRTTRAGFTATNQFRLWQRELNWTEFCAASTPTISELARRSQYQPNRTYWLRTQLNRLSETDLSQRGRREPFLLQRTYFDCDNENENCIEPNFAPRRRQRYLNLRTKAVSTEPNWLKTYTAKQNFRNRDDDSRVHCNKPTLTCDNENWIEPNFALLQWQWYLNLRDEVNINRAELIDYVLS